MRHRRVLVPASGFYEWHRPSKESGEKPQAYWIRPKNGGIVCFGGLMESYMSKDGSELDTGCILTVGANRTIAEIHDRMPVVIEPPDFSRWLDCRNGEPRDVADLLRAADEDYFEAIPVSDLVNKVANVGPELQAPVTPEPKKQKPAADKSGNGQMSLFKTGRQAAFGAGFGFSISAAASTAFSPSGRYLESKLSFTGLCCSASVCVVIVMFLGVFPDQCFLFAALSVEIMTKAWPAL